MNETKLMKGAPLNCSSQSETDGPKCSLGAFYKLSTDEINHIFKYLGGDIQKMNAINIEFHTIVQTTSAFRILLDWKCDVLLKQVAEIVMFIKAADDNTLDTLYQVIMKDPMANIEKLDKIMKKCQVVLHSVILNVLCQLQIFVSHYQPKQKELLQTLTKKFIFESLQRLTNVTATFSCIIDLISDKMNVSNQMIEQMNNANIEITEHTENGTRNQQSILMRLATAVTISWDLMQESEIIFLRHQVTFQKLCGIYQKISAIYKLFIEARVLSVVKPEEFDLMEFIKGITRAIDESALDSI